MDSEFVVLQNALAGEYSLERELGRGGMGVVYLAREVQLDRLIAIKVLPSALSARAELRERFLREARTAAALSHPHIVPIHRVGEAAGHVYFAMAYVEGETLGERVRSRGPLSPEAATRLLREVAWALAYAHGRGVVHRDVKPDNILIEAATGRALVTDFGIARVGRELAGSEPEPIMGTAHFMSPEQAAGTPVDGRSDLYSLGVVGYLATTGRLPFDAPNVPALLVQQVREVPAPVATHTPGLPRALATAIDRCLAKDPDARYATGEALADALDASAVPRSQLPAPLRAWANAADPARVLYYAWSGIFTAGTLSELHRGGDWPITLAFGLLPIVPLTLFHLRKTYRVLRAGYTVADLRLALDAWRQERREEMAFDTAGPLPTPLKTLRVATLVLAGATAFLAFGSVQPHGMVQMIAAASTVGLTMIAAVSSHALGVPFLPRELRRRLTGSFKSWIWRGRLGTLAVKLLSRRAKGGTLPTGVAFRPTEMALGLAVQQLYDALPRAYRVHLSALPDVSAQLESRAATVRAHIASVEAVGGDTAAARAELGKAVAALEAIRLDLLRLHGGATDLGPLTTILEAASEVRADLERLGAANREVGGLVVTPI